MKGNIYAKPPQPILSEREKRLIDLLIQDGTMASDRCIADFLSNCYPTDNKMGRSPKVNGYSALPQKIIVPRLFTVILPG